MTNYRDGSGDGYWVPPPPTIYSAGSVQFGHVNLAAGLTDHQINFGGIAQVDGLCGYVPTQNGFLSSLSACLSEVAAGSAVSAVIFKNGVAVAHPVLSIPIGGTLAFIAMFVKTPGAPGHFPFQAGDSIDVRVTTGAGWSALNADIGVTVGVSYYES